MMDFDYNYLEFLERLLESMDCEDLEDLERRVYKDTECGAWIKIEDTFRYGPVISLGSIIEGQCGEIEATPYHWLDDEEDNPGAWIIEAMEWVDGEVDRAYDPDLD